MRAGVNAPVITMSDNEIYNAPVDLCSHYKKLTSIQSNRMAKERVLKIFKTTNLGTKQITILKEKELLELWSQYKKRNNKINLVIYSKPDGYIVFYLV